MVDIRDGQATRVRVSGKAVVIFSAEIDRKLLVAADPTGVVPA